MNRYATRTNSRYYTDKAPLCSICKVRPASLDIESGSHFSWCDEGCFWLVCDAPYCHHTDHYGKATPRTVLQNGGINTTTETALYACPDGHGTATRTGWAKGSGLQSGRADALRKLAEGDTLVDTRIRTIGADRDAEHPVRRAYARAYLQGAEEVLGR